MAEFEPIGWNFLEYGSAAGQRSPGERGQRASTDRRPVVIVLPGIMGTHLAVEGRAAVHLPPRARRRRRQTTARRPRSPAHPHHPAVRARAAAWRERAGRGRSDVAAHERFAAAAPAPVVLRPHRSRPEGRRKGLCPAGARDPGVDGRRQDLHARARRGRRQPRALDRPDGCIADDPRQRHRRDDQRRRRQVVVAPGQPADGRVLPRERGRAVPVPGLWRAAGTRNGRDREPQHERLEHRPRTMARRRARNRNS